MKIKYKISSELLDFIKKFEGFSEEVYICAGGMKTIGYGHALKSGESFQKITQEEAEEILKADINLAINYIEEYLTNHNLTEKQYMALISFVFNVGIGNFSQSTLLAKINSHKLEEATVEFKRWNKSKNRVLKGLVRRRLAEEELFAPANQ